jgi:hypothetical protein
VARRGESETPRAHVGGTCARSGLCRAAGPELVIGARSRCRVAAVDFGDPDRDARKHKARRQTSESRVESGIPRGAGPSGTNRPRPARWRATSLSNASMSGAARTARSTRPSGRVSRTSTKSATPPPPSPGTRVPSRRTSHQHSPRASSGTDASRRPASSSASGSRAPALRVGPAWRRPSPPSGRTFSHRNRAEPGAEGRRPPSEGRPRSLPFRRLCTTSSDAARTRGSADGARQLAACTGFVDVVLLENGTLNVGGDVAGRQPGIALRRVGSRQKPQSERSLNGGTACAVAHRRPLARGVADRRPARR